MWINKNKYENMKADITALRNRINNLMGIVDKHEQYINQLMRIHDLYAIDLYSVAKGGYYQFNRSLHKEPSINLGDIDNLTFTELAEYVINKKPITRIREHETVVCPKTECNHQ